MKEMVMVSSLAFVIALGSALWGGNFWIGMVYLMSAGSVAFAVVALIGCGMVWGENPATRDIFKEGGKND